MKQGTYVSGEKTGKGRKVEMKTLPVHQVGHEERCEQKTKEADWGNGEKTQRREEREEETRNGRERRDTPRGRRSCKFRDQRAIKRLQLHGE